MPTIAIPDFGSADVLEPRDLPPPSPRADEVAIDVAYAGVNFAEVLFRQGFVDVPLPYVPGIEAAGTVRAKGARVEGLEVGDRVAALTIVDGGGYGEVAVAKADLTVRLADLGGDVSLEMAAAAPSNSSTAFLALDAVARLREGERVLVHAAAGGVGGQLGQVARLLGAGEVVGVVGSEAKVPVAEALGYDEVLLREDWVDDRNPLEHGRGFDVIVDQVGGRARHANLRALAPLGRLVVMGNASGEDDVRVSTNELWGTNRAVAGFNLRDLPIHAPAQVGSALRRALEAVATQRLRIPVERLPLAAAAEAHRRIESGSSTGKIVLAVQPD